MLRDSSSQTPKTQPSLVALVILQIILLSVFPSRAEDRFLKNYNSDKDFHHYLTEIKSFLEKVNLYPLEDNSPDLSTPEECARTCREDEPPRHCYYHFTLEYYTTMNSACNLCRPRGTDNLFRQDCECVEADGYERGILTINRMIPGPSIQVCEGDKLVIDVDNKIEGVEVVLHWHGLFQEGYQYYDGVPFVTQCPITSDTTFRYQYSADNAGTHFYHSHISVHKIDGQYGSLVVRQPASKDPHGSLYDEDLPAHVIVLSDWMHDISTNRFPGLLRHDPGQTAKNILINGKGQWTDPSTNETTDIELMTFDVKPGKRYRFRLINSFCTVCLSKFTIEGHSLQLIAQDGEPIKPVTVDTIISSTGQRVDFILTANQTVNSYWIQVRGLGECEAKQVQQLAILRYSGALASPKGEQPNYYEGVEQGIIFNPPDNNCSTSNPNLVCETQMQATYPPDKKILKVEPDQRIILGFDFANFNSTLGEFFKPGKYDPYFVSPARTVLNSLINDLAFKFPPVPPISQHLDPSVTCNDTYIPDNCEKPCVCPQIYNIKKGSVVEVVVYDKSGVSSSRLEELDHPFHLHGYAFRVLMKAGLKKFVNLDDISKVLKVHKKNLEAGKYKSAPARDTVVVPEAGYVIIRFVADNPGWWFFHCHFLWHTASGMNVIFHVGEPDDLPPVPLGFPRCGSWTPRPSFMN